MKEFVLVLQGKRTELFSEHLSMYFTSIFSLNSHNDSVHLLSWNYLLLLLYSEKESTI